MKKRKYLLSLVCVLCFIMIIPFAAKAEITGGSCGSGVVWNLDENGVLTISGSGAMASYTSYKNVPWYSFADDVVSLVIEEGVTSIGNNAFRGCENLESASLPEGIIRIGKYAFRDCVTLEEIKIPDSVGAIDSCAFEGCELLCSVTLGESLVFIGNEAFVDCESLVEIKIPKSTEELEEEIFEGCDNINVFVYYNSAAMNYCVEYAYNHTVVCSVDFYQDEEPIESKEVIFGEEIILPENATEKEGYNFIGWEINSEVYSTLENISVTDNIVANALFELKTYIIVFNSNGGSNPVPVMKKHGVDINVPESEKEGYNFIGWSIDESLDTCEYKPGDIFSLNANTILYGVWEMKTYTVKFDVNGGEGNISDCTKSYWEKLQVPDVVPTLPGHTFMGWGISNEAVVARYQPGGLITENADITLYAVWKEGITPGDADNNGMVNMSDLMFMIKRLNNFDVSLTEDNKRAMDVFGDTYFNTKDVLKISLYLSGWSNIVLGE